MLTTRRRHTSYGEASYERRIWRRKAASCSPEVRFSCHADCTPASHIIRRSVGTSARRSTSRCASRFCRAIGWCPDCSPTWRGRGRTAGAWSRSGSRSPTAPLRCISRYRRGYALSSDTGPPHRVLRSTVRTCETGPYYPAGGRNGDPETRWEVLVVVQGAKWRCRDVYRKHWPSVYARYVLRFTTT